METKELRIGNWVSNPLQNNIPFKVDIRTLNTINEDNRTHVNKDQMYQPIPITEEWLVKLNVLFGFNNCGSQYIIEFGLDRYNVRLNYDVAMSKYIAEIKYVHQLQNLHYALTGKEL